MGRIPKKVLLSEDVGLFVEMEKSLFQRDGIEIVVAPTGSDLLQVFEEEKPDLVILDLHLGEIGGDEVCRTIKARAYASVHRGLGGDGGSLDGEGWARALQQVYQAAHYFEQ